MNIKNTLLVLFIFVISFIFGQGPVFLKSYGNNGYDYGRDIKQTLDTGYIATGSSSSFGSSDGDAFLMKIDSAGEFKWSYNYGGHATDWGESVVITNDSAFAIGGYTNSIGAGGFDFYLVRTDINGSPLWENTYGGTDWDRAYSMVQLPDSGFVLVGETYSFGAGEMDIYIVRTDKFGVEIWSTTYGGTENDFASDVLLHGDSIVVVGSTFSEGAGDSDGILLKYSIDGTLGSKIVVGSAGEDFFNSVGWQENYYIMGGSRSYNHYTDCDCGLDFWIYKVDTADLSVIADTTWFGEQYGEDIVYDMALNANNDMFYGGTTTSWGSVDISEGYTDAFVNKLLNNYYTAFDYVRNFGEMGNDDIQALDFCYDKGLVGIGSSTFNSPGGSNILIFRNDQINTPGEFSILGAIYGDITLNILTDELSSEIVIHPTIVKDVLFIDGINIEYTITLHNLNGQIVYQESTDKKQHDFSALSPGYYVLTIISDGVIYNEKIIKE